MTIQPDPTQALPRWVAATATADATRSWVQRPWAARTVRAVAFLVPVVLAVVAGLAARGALGEPDGWRETLLGLAVSLVVSVVVLVAFERLTRRLAPLGMLLDLSLAFPGEAPRRLGVALRAGSVGSVKRHLAVAHEQGLHGDAEHASEHLLALLAALSTHDRRSRGHAERVRALVDLIAEESGVDQAEREKLRWAALLHDIGMLHVPPAILGRRGGLTEDEWAIVRWHPILGLRTIGSLATWLGEWSRTISEHHERIDGSGYPYGLAGTDIHIGARILAVADAFEVMTSRRSYKPALSAAAARAELVAGARTAFDPAIVRTFLSLSIHRRRGLAALVAWFSQMPIGQWINEGLRKTGNAGAGAAVVLALLIAQTGVGSLDAPADEVAPIEQAAGRSAVVAGTSVLGAPATPADAADDAADPGPAAESPADLVVPPVEAPAVEVASAPSSPAAVAAPAVEAPAPAPLDPPAPPPVVVDPPAVIDPPVVVAPPVVEEPVADPLPPVAPDNPADPPVGTPGTVPAPTDPGPPTTPGDPRPVTPTTPPAGGFRLGITSLDAPLLATLADVDADGLPGQTVTGAAQPSVEDGSAIEWVLTAPESGIQLTGVATLTIDSRTEDGGRRGSVKADLARCAAGVVDFDACDGLAFASFTDSSWNDDAPAEGWATKVIVIGPVEALIPANARLVLRLGVQNGSDRLLFAFGSVDHESTLAFTA